MNFSEIRESFFENSSKKERYQNFDTFQKSLILRGQLPGKKSLKNRRRKLEKVRQKSGKSQGILRFKFGRHPEKIHKIGHSCINYIH